MVRFGSVGVLRRLRGVICICMIIYYLGFISQFIVSGVNLLSMLCTLHSSVWMMTEHVTCCLFVDSCLHQRSS